MKIGLLGLIASDLTDVNYDKLRFAADLGFHGVGAHITRPASQITDEAVENVKTVFANQRMPLLQIWGPYPSIISADETVRQAGVEGARDLVKLAVKLGIRESGVRPTSMSPRSNWYPDFSKYNAQWDWLPHGDNYKPETEDRLVRSLCEILETAEHLDVDVVLETHTATTLNTAENIKRIMERTGSKRLKINLDPCNFVSDYQTAFNLKPMLNNIFDLLGQYIATVHLKDFMIEDRFVVHITETVIGTGLMDFETILTLVNQIKPDAYVVVEHLPINLIPLAKRNLTQKIRDMGLPLG